MREIKFRAWDKKQKRMLNVYHWHKGDVFDTVTRLRGFTGEDTLVVGEDVELIQFTGLLDENGKGEELYQSDLITNGSRNGGKPHEIVWSEAYGAWCGKYGTLEYLIAQELAEITKVGNIYEDKEG